MKNFLIVSLVFVGMACFASDIFCPVSYDVTSSTSRFLSTVTGQRAFSQYIGNKILQKTIMSNLTEGKITTDLKSFSTRDLKAGKFKSLEIKGKDVNMQGIYISYFHIKTLCGYNYIAQNKSGDIIIKENIPLAVDIEFSEDNLNKTMQSQEYKRIISDINTLSGSLKVFNIESTYVKIKNDKFYYVVKYYIPFVKGYKTMVLVSDLIANNGEIEFSNTKILGDSVSFDVKYISKIINYVNPLDFSLQIQENKNAKVNIKNVKIVDNKVIADGIITLLKDKE